MKKLLLEAVLVAVTGAVLAFAANSLSPRGLKLTRDYFPTDVMTPKAAASAHQPRGAGIVTAAHPVEEKARSLGLQLADTQRAEELYHEARREPGAVVFIDARDTENYAAGHIPGAYQLDYYHKEDYLSQVIPLCLAARQVLVYCNGGACEDSLLTASVLLAPIVPKERLLVYAGAFTEWTNNRLPVEVGVRGSGKITESSTAQ